MAVRTDVSILWTTSPRIITVAAPSTEISIQDLNDTLRDAEDEPTNMDSPAIISAAGKENLGGGVQVGITATLLDAQLAFESRITPAESGSVTTPGTTTLIDSTANFVGAGVTRGSQVINYTDGSVGDVFSVDSATQLTVASLQGGTDNDFDFGDVYDIFNVVQCTISGGNLVAVDAAQIDLNPILPTSGTQVINTLSSSATIAQGSGGATPAQIADAVWDEATSAHTTNGTFGKWVQDLLPFKKWLGLK